MKILLILLLLANSILVEASTNLPETDQQTQLQLNIGRIKDYLEMASYGATIVIAIFAFVALKQIRLARLQLNVASDALVVAKDDIKIRSRREAIALAAKHCEDFGDVILPKLNTWCNEFKNKNITLVRWPLLNKTFDDTSIKDQNDSHAWVQKVRSQQLGNHACFVLNQCEAFAIYFATGAADEEVAFPVAGPLFCQFVEIFAPWLISMRINKDVLFTSGKYANTVRLYEIWSDRIRVR